jgi:nitrite reductase/ring-hydroxylating ferredoxin subunit
VHAALNYAALGLYTGSWLARRRGRRLKGALLALTGAGVLSGAGWLGGHLAYALGVGVDTTAFQHFPQDWTDVCAESDVPDGRPIVREADAVPMLLVRDNGRILALAARCTHRGGPLPDGTISDGCVTCPWHGSTFVLADGSIEHGPATRPQPTAEVRVVDGRLQVRRSNEPRALRTRPIGH